MVGDIRKPPAVTPTFFPSTQSEINARISSKFFGRLITFGHTTVSDDERRLQNEVVVVD